MNLHKCLEIGLQLGLDTLGECYNNVLVHASNLFPYDEIAKELDELEGEIKQIRANKMDLYEDTPAKSVLELCSTDSKVLERQIIRKLHFPVDGIYHYYVEIQRSVDQGQTWWYCGCGKYCKTRKEAEEYVNAL